MVGGTLPESACALPGLTRLTDAAGDTSEALGLVGTPATPGTDLLSFQLAQPYVADGITKLVFAINTDAGQSPQPPGSAWYVALKIPDPPPATTFHYRAVHMAWNGASPVFESYTPSPNNSGGVDGRFVDTAQPIIPADASSSYAPPYNKVLIVVKASDLGLNPGDTIAGFVSGVSQTTDPAGVGVAATTLIDQMPNTLAFASSYTVTHNNICAPLPAGIVSRKVHGAAGPFDINLPTSGNAGIECRTGGANNAYTLIYTFGTNLKFAGTAAVTGGNATAGLPALGPNLNQVTVNLTNVTNAQHLVVNLTGAQDNAGATLSSMSARLDVLLSDTTNNGAVNSSDISQTQAESGHEVTAANFREDVTANGAINSSDISAVQAQSGTALPPAPAQTTAPASGAPAKKQPKRTRPRAGGSF